MNEFSEITVDTDRAKIYVGKTYIAFSDNADGSDFVFDQQKAYVGFAVLTEQPTDKRQFIWKKVGGGGNDKPSIAAGLYETGTNYGTMIASWDELVESGAIVVDNGAVYRGKIAPDNLPAVNEYGFYFDVPYNDVESYAVVFHADGSYEYYSYDELEYEMPAGSAIYSQNQADMTSVDDMVAIFADEANMTWYGCSHSIYKFADFVGDLVLPNDGSVVSIDDDAFYGDTNLTGIDISSSEINIGSQAFRECSNLTRVKISSSVTNIADLAFYLCTSLESIGPVGSDASVVLPNTLKSVGENAFGECYGLTRVELPDGIETIGWSAFGLCTELTDVVLPDSITFIDGVAFSDCTALTCIEIPASVATVGNMLFARCTNLNSVTVLAETPPVITSHELYTAGLFDGCTSLTTIKVTASSVDAYKAADGWNEYAGIIVAK